MGYCPKVLIDTRGEQVSEKSEDSLLDAVDDEDGRINCPDEDSTGV
jgi:hypothetical protein